MTNYEKTKQFFSEVNNENGANYKLKILEKYQNPLLERILKMAYDRVSYTYGISLRTVLNFENDLQKESTLEDALDDLEKLSNRELTGNAALSHAKILIDSLLAFDAEIIKNIIDRDMKINIGATSINKVFKNLIQKPVYMRCGTYNEKTVKKVKYPALIQKKADGTYREFKVNNGSAQSLSRSGEAYEYPVIFEQLKGLKDGVYFGELIVKASEWLLDSLEEDDKVTELKEKFKIYPDLILPRDIGNGLINSLTPPHNNIILEVWDYVTLEEYQNAADKEKNKTKYQDRFEYVKDIDLDNIRAIEYLYVNSIQEALLYTSRVMQAGYEGSVLKNLDAVFKDGTSSDQLKLKLEIEADVRITGFTEGTGKNRPYFGAITFENDEDTIKGQVGVSSMSEKLRNWIHENRSQVIGKIMEVQFNDLTRARGSDTYGFSHPRFIELRTDKDEADTLDKVLEARQSAMMLGE